MFDANAEAALRAAAARRGVDQAALLAFAEVLSGGVALVADGGRVVPPLRFDPRAFLRRLPPALRPAARRAGLERQAAEDPGAERPARAAFHRAAQIDRAAALEACVWGLGRVPAAEARALGYADAAALADACSAGVAGQAEALMRRIALTGVATALARRDWAAALVGYLGRPSATADAAERLGAAEARWATRPPRPSGPAPLGLDDEGPAVGRLQRRLAALQPGLSVDAVFGRRTRAAVLAFQAEAGMPRDGVAWPHTQARLAAAARDRASGRDQVLSRRSTASVGQIFSYWP